MRSVDLGRAGELLFEAAAILTSDGFLEPFRPEADSDHRDVAVGRRDLPGTFYVQVKTADRLTEKGLVQAHAHFAKDVPPLEDPGFLYAVLLLEGITLARAWIVPSADFNRLAYRSLDREGALELHLRARPEGGDLWAAYLTEPLRIGRVLAGLTAAGAPGVRPAGTLGFTRTRPA